MATKQTVQGDDHACNSARREVPRYGSLRTKISSLEESLLSIFGGDLHALGALYRVFRFCVHCVTTLHPHPHNVTRSRPVLQEIQHCGEVVAMVVAFRKLLAKSSERKRSII